MRESKNCIFHIPNKLDKNSLSGSQVRPRMMIRAFENIGYQVDVVMGYGEERKNSINKIKKQIIQGKKYDFLYSESSTMPTLLTEKNHLPLYPNLDFGFFKFCKKFNIKIGLFYRDIHWKFPRYKEMVGKFKYFISHKFYVYDLIRYEELLDVLYVTSEPVMQYISSSRLRNIHKILPPGSYYDESFITKKRTFFQKRDEDFNSKLKLFYVGGITGAYEFIELVKAVSQTSNIHLILCCRAEEWKNYKYLYEEYLNENISIVHESSTGLEKYYLESDICLAYFKSNDYMRMSVPIKFYEYVSHVTPVITSDDLIISGYVNDNDIGWSIPYSYKSIDDLLIYLQNNYAEIVRKHNNSIDYLKLNTWEKRAIMVSKDLSI